jgi:EmrB/QacA subfamily drug resistance transporter
MPFSIWLVLLSVALGQFMVVADVTILNVALPALSRDLHTPMASIEWALIAYSLSMIGLVPTFGKLSDTFGRKRLYILGLVVFVLGSGLAALSTSIGWLIFARVVQATGGALITSNVLAIITDTFPEGKRGLAMGLQSILISGGAALGPTLGGFLVTHFGWPWVFLINIPIGIIAVIFGIKVLPPLKGAKKHAAIDWLGAGILLIGLFATLLAITKGPEEWGWLAGPTLGTFAAGVLFLTLFFFHERRCEQPLIKFAIFKIRAFTAGQLTGMVATLAMASLTFLFPFYWQSLREYSAEMAGVLMLPLPLGIMICAPISGFLSDSWGARGITTTGLVLAAGALFLLSAIGVSTPIAHVMWRFALFGVGLGMFLAPNNNAVMSASPSADRGVAAGLLALFRFTGQSLGVAVGGTIFIHAAGGISTSMLEGKFSAATKEAFVRGFHAVCVAAACMTVLAAAVSLQRGKVTRV